MSFYNPFQNLEVRIPNRYRDEVDRFCQTQPGGGRKPSIEDSPFFRQIDLWFFAFTLGVRNNELTDEDNWHRIITGEILSRDSYRIHMIELAAMSITDDPYIISEPRKVMDLANRFAASGISKLLTHLESGPSKAIWNLTDRLIEISYES